MCSDIIAFVQALIPERFKHADYFNGVFLAQERVMKGIL